MRYHYESKRPQSYDQAYELYSCDHPLYHECTLWRIGDKGLAVVQKRFNEKLKVSWWTYVNAGLAVDIEMQKGFKDFLETHAAPKDENGLYPTMNVRKVMWALRMKPLKREAWENEF